MQIEIKFFKDDLPYSLEKSEEDVGYDLRAKERTIVHENKVSKIGTGVYLEIPLGVCGLVKNKSSIGLRGMSKTAQVIDPGYRGEIQVCLNYNGQEGGKVIFEKGQKIAQIVFVPYFDVDFVEVSSKEELSSTDRGEGGFGSSGKF